MLKKTNAILATATAVSALIHTVTMGLLLLGKIGFNPMYNSIGKILLAVFGVHVLISLIIMFLSKGNGLQYPKLNKSIIEQRIAAILLLVFIHFHMKNYFVDNAVVQPGILGFITEILFIFVIMCHFMPSADKVLTTLGIYNKATVSVVKVIALLAFIFSLAAVSFYFLGAIL